MAPRRVLSTMCASFSTGSRSPVTGLAPGPHGVGVTTLQLSDPGRVESGGSVRRLRTEVWYPAVDGGGPRNRYSQFLTPGTPSIIAAAEAPGAIGGYREGLTIAELDAGQERVIQRRFNVGVLEAIAERNASTL